jgi:hypothetical protein
MNPIGLDYPVYTWWCSAIDFDYKKWVAGEIPPTINQSFNPPSFNG